MDTKTAAIHAGLIAIVNKLIDDASAEHDAAEGIFRHAGIIKMIDRDRHIAKGAAFTDAARILLDFTKTIR